MKEDDKVALLARLDERTERMDKKFDDIITPLRLDVESLKESRSKGRGVLGIILAGLGYFGWDKIFS